MLSHTLKILSAYNCCTPLAARFLIADLLTAANRVQTQFENNTSHVVALLLLDVRRSALQQLRLPVVPIGCTLSATSPYKSRSFQSIPATLAAQLRAMLLEHANLEEASTPTSSSMQILRRHLLPMHQTRRMTESGQRSNQRMALCTGGQRVQQ